MSLLGYYRGPLTGSSVFSLVSAAVCPSSRARCFCRVSLMSTSLFKTLMPSHCPRGRGRSLQIISKALRDLAPTGLSSLGSHGAPGPSRSSSSLQNLFCFSGSTYGLFLPLSLCSCCSAGSPFVPAADVPQT